MSYSGKKILVTGGLGLIGSNLANELVRIGAEVTILDSLYPAFGGNMFNIKDFEDRINIVIGDIRNKSLIQLLVPDCEIIFNLAAQTSHIGSMKDPKNDLEINSLAQLNILEVCKELNPKVKIVYASTRQIYGKPDYLPVDESHPIRPVDVNGINKLSGENFHLLYNNLFGIRASILRLTNTYGPGMRIKDARQTFLGIWLRSLIEGEPVKVFGDGMQIRDFNYVSDSVDALLVAGISEKADGKIFNLGNADVIQLKDLAEMLIEINGKGNYELVPFPAERSSIDIGNYFSDYTKIQKELGWQPKVNLRTGLALCLSYYKENFTKYV